MHHAWRFSATESGPPVNKTLAVQGENAISFGKVFSSGPFADQAATADQRDLRQSRAPPPAWMAAFSRKAFDFVIVRFLLVRG
jgi:hypothetical protein